MPDTRLYFDPVANKITGTYNTRCTEITKDQVPELIRKGAEVDDSAREVNGAIKRAEQQR